MLGCTDRHVLSLIRDGELKAIKIGGRAMRVSEHSLREFIETHAVNPEDFFCSGRTARSGSPAALEGCKVEVDEPMNEGG